MTQQKRDILHYKNSNFYILNDLLYQYFNDFPERRFITPFMLTSLWRGYFAEFEIVNDELLIKSIKRFIDYDSQNNEFVIEDVTEKAFPYSKKIDFISGLIRFDDNYSDNPEKQFRFIKIENGNFIEELNIEYSKYIQLLKEENITIY